MSNGEAKADWTALHRAAWTKESIANLDVTNVDINAQDKDGFTALHLACYQGSWTVVQELLQRNAAQDITDQTGGLARDYAHWRHPELLRFLTPCLERKFNHEDLTHATGGKVALGVGAYGTVYPAVLSGINVAVKVMDPFSALSAVMGAKQFWSEVSILSNVHHPHIVLLMGACIIQNMLVYELLEQGSLHDFMLRKTPLLGRLLSPDQRSWQSCVRIACELASGLNFLHTAQPCVCHLDVKPANVLLDKHLTAKLSDVGMSSTILDQAAQPRYVVGTEHYKDPDYSTFGRFSPQTDVYSYGVTLAAILMGRDAYRGIITHLTVAREALPDAPTTSPPFRDLVDETARWPQDKAEKFADIALQCASYLPKDRPQLGDVVERLKQLT